MFLRNAKLEGIYGVLFSARLYTVISQIGLLFGSEETNNGRHLAISFDFGPKTRLTLTIPSQVKFPKDDDTLSPV